MEQRIRTWANVAALVAGVIWVVSAIPYVLDDALNGLPVAVVVITGLLIRFWPEQAALTAAVGAGLAAFSTSGFPLVVPVVGVLVFVAVVADPGDVPWRGWVSALLGWSLAVVFDGGGTVAPFFATCIGGLLGLLVRTRTRTEQLERETTWLEQRSSVARELHDVVGHHVTAMVVQAEAGQLGDPRQALATVADLGRTALQELDALVVHLRDPRAPLTVTAPPRLLDIDELLAAPLRASGVEVAVDVPHDLVLGELEVLTVYRVAQEGLTNVARHARARHAWVEVSRDAGAVRVRVSDDGVGVSSDRKGSGLVGISERVAAHDGRVELTGRPGGGTILDVTFSAS